MTTLRYILAALLISLSVHASDCQTISKREAALKPWHNPLYKKYFDKKWLADVQAVREDLIKNHGFKEIEFAANDGVTLSGLLRIVPHATTNIISCCGFYPGLKEGMSNLIHIIPNIESTNILLMDARGHGQSGGRFWTYGGDYGLHEYNDIIGAVMLMHERAPQADTIIHGLCFGGFHAAHACIKMSMQVDGTGKTDLEKYNVKGMVFDSGVNSLLPMRSAFKGHIIRAELATKVFKKIYSAPRAEIMKRIPFRVTAFAAGHLLAFVRALIFDPHLIINDPDTRLDNKIHKIACPVWFTHALSDGYTCQKQTALLADRTPVKQTYWFEGETEHADNNRLHPHMYAEKLKEFIAFCKDETTWKQQLAASCLHKEPIAVDTYTTYKLSAMGIPILTREPQKGYTN